MNDTTNQPPLTDREKAAGYRVRLTAALERVCGIMDEAARDGFEVQFQIINEPPPVKIANLALKLKL